MGMKSIATVSLHQTFHIEETGDETNTAVCGISIL